MRLTTCSPDDLLDRTGHDPLIRTHLTKEYATRAWCADDAVAALGLDAEERVRVLLGLGDPASAGELTGAVAGELGAAGRLPPSVTVPRGAMAHLPAELRPARFDDWDWRHIAAPPPAQRAEDRVCWLPTEADEEIKALLTIGNPTSSAQPGDAKVRRWAGVRAPDGGLVACLADTTRVAGIGHISGIATDPRARGQGLGTAITAWAARRMFAEEAELVTLGMYADNTVARHMYDRLGFSDDHRMSSGRFPAGSGPPGTRRTV